MLPRTSSRLSLMALALSLAAQSGALAADVVINVTGIADARGAIGCALFPDGRGFPMDNSGAKALWLPADPKGVSCRYADLPDGTYAVSVSHDLNGNRRTDTNFLGIPTEAWGVSNNARPTMRAPRFDEAAFQIVGGQSVTIDVRVAK
ncbi:MAG: DUF2141 domain-containing protein [Reyranella sp.]